MKNFRTATGKATQAGIFQLCQDLGHRLLGQKLKPIQLDGRPAFEMDLRVSIMQDLQSVFVPFKFLLMMQSADNMHFGATVGDRFGAACEDLFVRHDIAFLAAQIGAEGAESTAVHADVSRVQMRVDVVVGRVATFAFAHQIGQLPDVVERNFWIVKQHAIVHRQTLARFNFFLYGRQSWVNGINHRILFVSEVVDA